MQKLFFGLGMIFLSFPIFSQKNELKDIERLVSKKNFSEAQTALDKAGAVFETANDEQKTQYHYLTALTALGLAQADGNNDKEIEVAIQSFNKVKELERKTKSRKYTDKIDPVVNTLLAILVNQAIDLNNSNQEVTASRKFNQAYNLSPKDTTYLYYAAGSALNGKDFDFAENRYKELIRLKYNGATKTYTALNLSTKKVESFGTDKKLRDLLVRQGSHADAKMVEEEGKKPEIYKNLAFILMQKENYSEAEDLLLDAYNLNKKDETILLALMELYLSTNRFDMYEQYAGEALEAHPDRKVILYNLGVVAFQNQEYDKAKNYFTKATKGKNASDNAYVMLANIRLMDDADITNKLNDLSNKTNSAEYKKLYQQKTDMYTEALQYLTEALKINPENGNANNLAEEIQMFLDKKINLVKTY